MRLKILDEALKIKLKLRMRLIFAASSQKIKLKPGMRLKILDEALKIKRKLRMRLIFPASSRKIKLKSGMRLKIADEALETKRKLGAFRVHFSFVKYLLLLVFPKGCNLVINDFKRCVKTFDLHSVSTNYSNCSSYMGVFAYPKNRSIETSARLSRVSRQCIFSVWMYVIRSNDASVFISASYART